VWLYDVVEPNEEFSVAHYTSLARPLISDIWQRGKLPIVVGGTGLYISSILRGIGTEGIAPKPELRGVLDKLSLGILQKLLAVLHSHAWERLNKSDRANPRRLIRKIEIAMSGKDRETGGKNPVVADTCIVGLTVPFQYLDEKINRRVDERVKQGIVREIETLLSRGVRFSDPAMTSLGYREWQPFFTGARDSEILKREIIESWKKHERQYARRQMTWFRRANDIRWFDIRDAHVSTKIERMASAWYTG
jgi:tRNA dimethylallyltransferase